MEDSAAPQRPASTGLAGAVGTLLPALNAAFPHSVLPVLSDFLGEHVGASDVQVLLADYDLRTLRRLTGGAMAASVPVEDSGAGRAFVAQGVIADSDPGGVLASVPITLRAERLGVLQVRLPSDLGGEQLDTTLDGLEQTATLLAYILTSAASYTDLVERARREQPLTLPAEMQWSLLPVRAYASDQLSVAGQLVPAYEVGGDLFDYALEADQMQVSVIDAMGHGLHASLLGALTVTALRNARRTGLDLTHQARQADSVLYRHFGGAQFVTGLLCRLEYATGRLRLVNAGHPPPYLLRDGDTAPMELDPQLPMGLFERTRYVESEHELRPGDRLVLVSDGVLEATAPDGEEFGETRLEGFLLGTAALAPTEVVRQLVRTIADYQGVDLRDDATVVCLDWHGS